MSRLKELRVHVDKKLNKIEDEDKRISAAAHLYGVSLAAQILAKKRGLDSELAAMAGMLHDMHAYKIYDFLCDCYNLSSSIRIEKDFVL